MMFTLRSRHHILALFVAAATASAWHSADATPRMAKVYDPKAAPLTSGALMTGGGQPHLSQSQYNQLKYVGTEVLKRFPPATHYYFGLGRSPGAIISMIQNLAADQSAPEKIAMNFPASGIHDGGVHDDASYFRHFDAMIPQEVVNGTRSIVLLDRSRPFSGPHSGGESLQIFKQILVRYLVARGSSVKVEAVGFSYGKLNPAFGLHHIPFDLQTRPELERISMAHYEDIAEYPHHRIAPNMNPPARRATYDKYKAHMLERMKRDPVLDAFLDANLKSELKEESAEEKAARVALEAKEEAARIAVAREKEHARVAEAEAFPTDSKKRIDALVEKLPELGEVEGHPYFTDNAEAMNGWLQKALTVREQAAKLAPSLQKAGPNLVVTMFMDKVQQARVEKKIRNRDYRRLMGHAMSAAVMDAPMLQSLVSRYQASKYFQTELSQEREYYLSAPNKKSRPATTSETANMAAHFLLLQAQLPATTVAPKN